MIDLPPKPEIWLPPKPAIIRPSDDLVTDKKQLASIMGVIAARRRAAKEPHIVNAVTFDSINDWLTRGADITGVTDGKEGIVSYWIKFASGSDGTAMRFWETANSSVHFRHRRIATNTWQVSGQDTGGGARLSLTNGTAQTEALGWIHNLISWNLATDEAWFYMNDVDDIVTSTLVDGDIDYTQGELSIGAQPDGSNKVDADVAEFFMDLSTHLDLSVTANRRKFITGLGKPVDLGATGELPLGADPQIFLSGDESVWFTNKGTGGGFTENGDLTNASTSPSD